MAEAAPPDTSMMLIVPFGLLASIGLGLVRDEDLRAVGREGEHVRQHADRELLDEIAVRVIEADDAALRRVAVLDRDRNHAILDGDRVHLAVAGQGLRGRSGAIFSGFVWI